MELSNNKTITMYFQIYTFQISEIDHFYEDAKLTSLLST